jgi:hypothetical protein
MRTVAFDMSPTSTCFISASMPHHQLFRPLEVCRKFQDKFTGKPADACGNDIVLPRVYRKAMLNGSNGGNGFGVEPSCGSAAERQAVRK